MEWHQKITLFFQAVLEKENQTVPEQAYTGSVYITVDVVRSTATQSGGAGTLRLAASPSLCCRLSSP